MTDMEEKEMNLSFENNNSISNTSDGKIEDIDKSLYKKMIVETLSDPANVEVNGKPAYEMKNFANVTRSSVDSEGRRLDSEEFENISLSAIESKEQEDVFTESGNEIGATSKGPGRIHKKKGRSVDTFEPTEEVIEEEDLVESQTLKDMKNVQVNEDYKVVRNGRSSDSQNTQGGDVINNVKMYGGIDNSKISRNVSGVDAESSVVSDNDHWMTGDEMSFDRSMVDEDNEDVKAFVKGDVMTSERTFACRIMTLNDHGHLSDLRRRSEGANKLLDEQNTSRKHSSGDLHSRLKTRKLLGVGETDDGDVHRSKLSQILGHSDQLFIRLPAGLRVWQIILAVVLSVLSLWALIFPSHYFHAMYDIDGSTHVFPIRLYACALICISVIYWSTFQAADRNVIRMILLSSVVFFMLQSCVLMSSWLPRLPSTSPASFLCSVVMALIARLVVVVISSYYYWITFKDGKSKDVKYYR